MASHAFIVSSGEDKGCLRLWGVVLSEKDARVLSTIAKRQLVLEKSAEPVTVRRFVANSADAHLSASVSDKACEDGKMVPIPKSLFSAYVILVKIPSLPTYVRCVAFNPKDMFVLQAKLYDALFANKFYNSFIMVVELPVNQLCINKKIRITGFTAVKAPKC
jgi:hypothetical protein